MTTLHESRSVEAMRKRLKQRYRDLRGIMREELLEADAERYADIAELVHDLGDESAADLLADINLAIIDHHVEEVREIEAALGRIATGTYGACADCGASIDDERLQACPTAKRCLACQSRRERSYAQASHTKL